MQLPEELVVRLLAYFSQLLDKPIRSRAELSSLDASELLLLADRLSDPFLPALVAMLRRSGEGVFERLLGCHEEENRELSERFFARYRNMVLEPPEAHDTNPLEMWLPPHLCEDFGFLMSRQAFFMRQEIRHINDWLGSHFGLGPYLPGEQQDAWNDLWKRMTGT
jgi:hypothetical protein